MKTSLDETQGQKGFTLVEAMVALTIFSVIALAAIVILRLSINSNEQLERSGAMTAQFQVARALIKADLAQLRPRTVRDDYGSRLPGPVVGGNYALGGLPREEDGERLLLSLVSAVNINPGSRYPRSRLQYVEYLLIEDRIVRRSRNFPDAAEPTPSASRTLFEGVEDVDILFFDGQRWNDRFASASGVLAPRAVQLSFTHPVFGDLTQRFQVGAAEALLLESDDA